MVRRAEVRMELDDLLERVNSKATFLDFVNALAADFADEQEELAANPQPDLGAVAGPNGWYNHSVDMFLDAMTAWASVEFTMTHEPRVPYEPSGRSFAEMLYAAKIYE